MKTRIFPICIFLPLLAFIASIVPASGIIIVPPPPGYFALPYDQGPNLSWSTKFAAAPLNQYLVNGLGNGLQRFRAEYGPVFYRGRLDGTAKVLVVGQDPSTDEILVQRVMVGYSGQRVQKLLNKIGITKSYIMFNMSLFSIFGQVDNEMDTLMSDPIIQNYRNSLFDKVVAENNIKLIIAFGGGAQTAVANWPGKGNITVVGVYHPSAPAASVVTDWNSNLTALRNAIVAGNAQDNNGATVDLSPYVGSTIGTVDIPRTDLPFGVPYWHGTGGTTQSGRYGDNTIEWYSPL